MGAESYLIMEEDASDLMISIDEKSADVFEAKADQMQLEASRLVRKKAAEKGGSLTVKRNVEVKNCADLKALENKRDDVFQMFKIRQERSWSALNISRELFEDFTGVFGVFAPVWKCVSVFGEKLEEHECDFPGFRSQRTSKFLAEGSFECTYVLRRVERHGRKVTKEESPFSIRQTAVYHKMLRQQYSGVVNCVSGEKQIDRLLDLAVSQQQKFPPFLIHSLLIADSVKGWMEYAAWIEKDLKTRSDRITFSKLGSMDEDFSFSVEDRQELKIIEDKVIDLQTIIATLSNNIKGVQIRPTTAEGMTGNTIDEYSSLLPNPNPGSTPVPTPEVAPEEFEVSGMSASDSTTPESEDYTDSSSDTMSDRSPTPSNERLYRKANRNLQNQLFDGRVENPPGMHFFYIPGSRRDELITYDTIKTHIQLGNAGINTKEAAEFSEATVSSAKNLFAILACLRKGGDIVSFLKEGISDIHLPFLRCGGPTQFNLKGNDGKEIKNIKKWNRQRKEDFDRFQWWLLTPFFSIGDHHDLAPNAALPFVPSTQQREEDKNPSTGAYSEVSIVQLHDNQHDFWGACVSNGTGLQVAIKKLKDNIEKEFEKEHTILKILGNKPHDHLVKLLASYKHQGHYHLIFPRANSNLRTYWESHSNPSFDRETILWTLWQMKGIASGLNTVHNFKVTIPLSVDGNFKLTQDNQKLGVKAGEEWYGRHGDIKPENILWFERTLHSRDGRGALQIADFGLGRFHGRESRTRAAGYHIFSSPTYEPPECHVHLKVSRAYDLWSLGCLFLEFLTWLLDGSDAIDDFAKSRSEDSFILNQEGKIKDDYFWTLWFDGAIRKAKPRKGVQDWATKLREHKKCSMLIRELLDLIVDGLLQIEPEKQGRS
ncbi:hypothetical protein GTA08_BOTSDO00080 [Botryosphaeria dothidea]|uniref:Protein kinase domain-containing protein n=1 Tax=Botryosphaeria dothidea TaxID=55169 RepID=A0A8H4JA95_9PEZI|nr:hypothetical protein GTA08_BOTSDO00080 [Botryosphaeria dothidea]